MLKTIKYNFYKEVNGIKVYRELLGNKYSLDYKEGGKTISIHFYFDYNKNLIIDNIYKSGTNYKNYRYIKKYAENEMLINIMMQFKEEI